MPIKLDLLFAIDHNVRIRRILPIPARSGGGRLSERTPAVQPRRRERVKVPLSGRCPRQARTAQEGGRRSFPTDGVP
jgi:hypothetical protein